ncbi:MAG: DUF1559 domain-containing protein [Planctomycetaceae bacterium]|nr:DUF1559 domain-containing protein [Planctomycetaceae bacterium]
MAKCPRCDTIVEKNALACPACGAKFRQKLSSNDVPEELEDFEEDGGDSPTRSRQPSRGRKADKSKSNTSAILIILACVGGISICFCIPVLLALLLPAVQQARDAARTAQAMNHMKQIGLGAHNFHDSYNQFPPRGVSRIGNLAADNIDPNVVPQAFFTDILPFIDQAGVHAQIRYSQPWSDPTNKGPLATVIPTYIHPAVSSSPLNGQGYALAHYATNGKVVNDSMTNRIRDITDGTSNTVLVGSLNDGFKAWGDPTNHRDPALGFSGGPDAFGAPNKRFALILMCDGAVRRVAVTLLPDICDKLADPRDGQPIGEF